MPIIPLDTFFVQNIWLALILWAAVYISDYYLTIYSAHLFKAHLIDHLALEGSLELTPTFQRDVDQLRWLSPRFAIALVLSVVVLYALWTLTTRFFDQPYLFAVVVGGLVLREIAILARHIRNFVLFRAARTPGSVRGRVEYARWVTLRLSAAEHFTFAGLFYLMFLGVGSWVLLGGFIVSAVSGVQRLWESRHWYRQAQRTHS